MTSPFVTAAAGQVGEGFFKERSTGTLPCQAQAGGPPAEVRDDRAAGEG